jgi:hypothetical protein
MRKTFTAATSFAECPLRLGKKNAANAEKLSSGKSFDEVELPAFAPWSACRMMIGGVRELSIRLTADVNRC